MTSSLEEQTNKAKAVFRPRPPQAEELWLRGRRRRDVIREGVKARADRRKLIEGGHCRPRAQRLDRSQGSAARLLAGGQQLAGNFPIPITIVPGTLSAEEIEGSA
ncbi:MAG: hypothetical protein R3D33_00435 [Hyphomicrobiaceae bacterium]